MPPTFSTFAHLLLICLMIFVLSSDKGSSSRKEQNHVWTPSLQFICPLNVKILLALWSPRMCPLSLPHYTPLLFQSMGEGLAMCQGLLCGTVNTAVNTAACYLKSPGKEHGKETFRGSPPGLRCLQ